MEHPHFGQARGGEMKNKRFWEIVEEDKRIVETWPLWMQRIEITAESVSTGNFIREDLYDRI